MKTLASLAATTVTLAAAGAANAHPGHLDTAGGHSHWELLAGLAVLALAAVAIWVRARQ